MSESERVYGPPERREWLVLGKCVGCKVQGTPDRPLHQHHTETGGTGRKADASTLVGLCFQCHAYVHDHGQKAYERASGLDLRAEAARVQSDWQALGESSGGSA